MAKQQNEQPKPIRTLATVTEKLYDSIEEANSGGEFDVQKMNANVSISNALVRNYKVRIAALSAIGQKKKISKLPGLLDK